mmetsp:Transcript_1802/g.7223  ORF Transcript_1802/g.7223 Transcript_1802/m.7223 type:complete len:217 (-) Transcript_1802:2606-3256(-)
MARTCVPPGQCHHREDGAVMMAQPRARRPSTRDRVKSNERERGVGRPHRDSHNLGFSTPTTACTTAQDRDRFEPMVIDCSTLGFLGAPGRRDARGHMVGARSEAANVEGSHPSITSGRRGQVRPGRRSLAFVPPRNVPRHERIARAYAKHELVVAHGVGGRRREGALCHAAQRGAVSTVAKQKRARHCRLRADIHQRGAHAAILACGDQPRAARAP